MNEIIFLNKTESRKWIDKYHTSYIKNVISNKMNLKVRSYSDIPTFKEHLLEWTNHQKNKIISLVKRLYETIPPEWKWLLSSFKWHFILVTNQLESGMPHTIHSAIVLSKIWVKNSNLLNSSFIETLLHERIHNYQKINPSIFHNLYKQWGWRPLYTSTPELIDSSGSCSCRRRQCCDATA